MQETNTAATPEDTVPGETVSEDTVPSETVQEDTVPEDTVPKEVASQAASPDATVISSATAPAGAVDPIKMEQLVIDALHTIFDPEIPVDIYELGLIYSINVSPDGKIAVTMTLTTPACPVAGSMPGTVEKTIRLIDGVTDVVVDLVWEPTWGPAMMTESARLQLNMY